MNLLNLSNNFAELDELIQQIRYVAVNTESDFNIDEII